MISVHIAAASAVVRAGLEAVVKSDAGLAVSSADSAESLERRLSSRSNGGDIAADVLLLAIPRLTEEWIGTLAEAGIPAVILTEPPESAMLLTALRTCIRAVLSAETGASEIAAALTAAAAGLIAMEPGSLDALNQGAPHASGPLDDPLTPREVEVLTLLAEGHSNKLIALSLGISEHTVKFHVTAIMSKLHAGSRTDAVMQGIRRGLIMI